MAAHNEYLQIEVELRLSGLVLFLLGLGVRGWEAEKTLEGTLPRWDRGAVLDV